MQWAVITKMIAMPFSMSSVEILFATFDAFCWQRYKNVIDAPRIMLLFLNIYKKKREMTLTSNKVCIFVNKIYI